MAIVTGLTAEKMLELADEMVVVRDAIGTPLIHENFDSDPLAQYSGGEGTSLLGLSVSGGSIAPTDTDDHIAIHNTAMTKTSRILLKFTPGTAAAIRIMIKYIDTDNFLMCEYYHGDLYRPRIYQKQAGSYTSIANGTGLSPISPGDPLFMVARLTGNIVICEGWQTDPRGGCAPYNNLMASVAPAFDATVAGKVGFRLMSESGTPPTADEFIVVSHDNANILNF